MQFLKTLYNVLIMFFYITPAFILKKVDWIKTEHLVSISSLLLYICAPALMLDAFQKCEFTKDNIIKIGKMFLVSFLLQIIAVVILMLIFYKKIEESKYRIAIAAGIFGNCAFFGLPLINALFPGSPICVVYVVIYTTTQNILIFTVAIYCITLDKQYVSILKALLNPATLSFIVAFIVFLTKWKYPKELADAFSSLSKMATCICMQILGIRLASVESLTALFKRPFVYLALLIKLGIFPIFCYLISNWIPWWDKYFVATLVIEAATPTAVFILGLSEQYGKEQELASNSILLSTIACVVTLPLITLLFEET